MGRIYYTDLDDTTTKQLLFADHGGSYVPTGNNIIKHAVGPVQNAYLVMLDWLTNTAIQSAKIDLGPLFAGEYAGKGCIPMQLVKADAGAFIEVFWSGSLSATAAVGNSGGASGVAGGYTGNDTNLDKSLMQLQRIGTLKVSDLAVPSEQVSDVIGTFFPTSRWGCFVARNKTGQTICDTTDVEGAFLFFPAIQEVP